MQLPYIDLQFVLPFFDPGIWQAASSARHPSVQEIAAFVADFDDADLGVLGVDSPASTEVRLVAFCAVTISVAMALLDLALILSAFRGADSLATSALSQL